MKKIALLSYGYLTKDPRILTIADSLTAYGWNVICINLSPKQQRATQQSALFSKHTCYNIQSFYFSNILSLLHLYVSKITNPIKKDGIDYFLACKRYVKTVINDKHFIELTQDVDIFYGCEMFFGAFMAYYAAKMGNKEFIFDIKELYSEMHVNQSKEQQQLIAHYEQRFIHRSMTIPCVSQGIAQYYAEKIPCFINKYVLLPNVPSINPLIAHTSSPLTTKKNNLIRFVMFANFSPTIRGIEHLIGLWHQINTSQATLDLYLSNLSKKNKKKLLAIAGNTASLRILEPISEDDIVPTLTYYDIGIIPYLPDVCLNHLYCAPGKFGQYLKAGLMILSSDTREITKKINEFQIGYIYPTNDNMRACDIFQHIINHPQEINETKKRALEFFKKHYHWEIFADNLLKKLPCG